MATQTPTPDLTGLIFASENVHPTKSEQPQSPAIGGHHSPGSVRERGGIEARNSRADRNGSLERDPQPGASPVRQDTTSSTSTIAPSSTPATILSGDTAAAGHNNGPLPSCSGQAGDVPASPVSGGKARDVSESRRPRAGNRRRTGPLTHVQRQRASIIRRIGACLDCRKRRVAVGYEPVDCHCRYTRH